MPKISLYPYQKDAVNRMHNGCILCAGVGTGKSMMSLAYYFKQNGGDIDNQIKMKNPCDLYVVTTAQKRDTCEWEGELARFAMSTNPKCNYYKNKIVVDSWNNIKKYVDVKDAFFIFDEQRVTGSGSWVKAFLKITKVNRWILLSATPADVWLDYVPVFLANGFYKNKTEFIRNHVIYSRFTKYPKIDRYVNIERLIRLRNRVLVDVDFNRKTVPHHIDIPVTYDIAKYKEVTRTRWDPFKDEPIRDAAGLCYIWRKIVNSDPSRLVAIQELAEKHPKMIVFYNYDYEREMLMQAFNIPWIEIAEWSGHAHQPIPDGDRWLYLVNYMAGNAGWNCVRTNTIVFFSQNYSYKIMQQASGRVDRLNTPFTDLYYYHLKSKSGIDLAISKALRDKKNFNEGKFVKW